jgi:tocopherol O-methyltransferase
MEIQVDTGLTPVGSVEELHRAIREHYDGLIDLYEEIWGEHIHHGYWDLGDSATDRQIAQQRTVTELATFCGLPPSARVLDAGCGVGAAAIMLARDYGCAVEGITLSAQQVRRAAEKADEAGVADRVTFRLMDAMHTDYDDASFDAVWSLESCELMPDKAAFLAECFRVLRPGGRLLVATWCCRDANLSPAEVRLLRRIYRDFAASHALPLDHYALLCEESGYSGIATADWTDHVRGTWKVSTDSVVPLLKDPSYIWRLVRVKGVNIFRFANSVPLMKQAYDKGLMRYGVFCGTRPNSFPPRDKPLAG